MKPIELWHGDCLEMMQRIPDGSVDCVIADLPYGTLACAWDTPLDLSRLWTALFRLGKRTCPFIFFSTQPFTTSLIVSNKKYFKYDLVWQKDLAANFFSANRRPLCHHEHILIFYRSTPAYNAQRVPRKTGKIGYAFSRKGKSSSWSADHSGTEYQIQSTKNPSSIVTASSVGRRASLHPTQKPIALLQWLINSYSNKGDTILDPTMGSASTAHACVGLGRRCIGIERDAKYYRIAVDRIRKAMAEPQQREMAI